MHPTTVTRVLIAGAALTALAGCGIGSSHKDETRPSRSAVAPTQQQRTVRTLPGMPPVLDPKTSTPRTVPIGSPSGQGLPVPRLRPNTNSNTVSVIDPGRTRSSRRSGSAASPSTSCRPGPEDTLGQQRPGQLPHPIDPRTGKAGDPVDVHDPYNLYFTPNGKYAVVMASKDRRLVFRDAHTMKVAKSLPVDCSGVNHADFSIDGRYFIVSCEFSGELLRSTPRRWR